MKALKFTIQLDEPLLATQPNAGEANSATSYAFIPGSMIRGALVRIYQEQKTISDLAGDQEARSLFFDGTVCFLNAYPVLPGSGTRMLPTPFSWFTDKDSAGDAQAKISDFAVAEDEKIRKPKHPRGEFLADMSAGVVLFDPARQVNVHNASTDRSRKAARVSQVYRYDALAKDQIFGGAIVSENETLLNVLAGLFGKNMFLGGSHTGGYGRVTVQLEDTIATDWEEYTPKNGQSADGMAIITLLSDVILPAGRMTALDVLAKALYVSQIESAFYEVRLVGGFNRKWGLPLYQAWALQAGSVLRVKKEALLANAPTGIGERQVDGFGRIAINWHSAPTQQRIPIKNEPGKIEPDLTPTSQKLAARMRTRLLRTSLEKNLTTFLTSNLSFSDLPSSSQINRVRVVARQALLSGDTTTISSHMQSIQGAKKFWERAKLNGAPLYGWVIEHSQMDEALFRKTFQIGNNLPTVAENAGILDEKLIHEFCTRLIDGVMKLAAEQAREKEGR